MIHTKIAGTSFIEGGESILSLLQKDMELNLVPEPENHFDDKAVAVYKGTVKLGYLPKKTANSLFEEVVKGTYKCHIAEVTGGTTDKPNRGVNLCLTN